MIDLIWGYLFRCTLLIKNYHSSYDHMKQLRNISNRQAEVTSVLCTVRDLEKRKASIPRALSASFTSFSLKLLRTHLHVSTSRSPCHPHATRGTCTLFVANAGVFISNAWLSLSLPLPEARPGPELLLPLSLTQLSTFPSPHLRLRNHRNAKYPAAATRGTIRMGKQRERRSWVSVCGVMGGALLPSNDDMAMFFVLFAGVGWYTRGKQ